MHALPTQALSRGLWLSSGYQVLRQLALQPECSAPVQRNPDGFPRLIESIMGMFWTAMEALLTRCEAEPPIHSLFSHSLHHTNSLLAPCSLSYMQTRPKRYLACRQHANFGAFAAADLRLSQEVQDMYHAMLDDELWPTTFCNYLSSALTSQNRR